MSYPIIETFSTSENFRYLWMKYVQGFDLSVHCAKCLLGVYSRYFHAGRTRATGLALSEAPAKFFYICGVTEPYRYRDNLHIAFRYKSGSSVNYDDGKTRVTIRDAELIEIQRQSDYSSEPCGCLAEYHTCRNWRFAYQMTHLPMKR